MLWPQFCTREGKGSVATGFYISYLVGNFPLRPHCFHFTGFESLTVLSPNRWPLLRGYPLKPCFSLWLQIIAVKQIIFKHHILHPPWHVDRKLVTVEKVREKKTISTLFESQSTKKNGSFKVTLILSPLVMFSILTHSSRTPSQPQPKQYWQERIIHRNLT